VEIADQLQEVRLFLHHDGLVAVLEEVADALMAAVEGACVAREEGAHTAGQRALPGSDQEVGVIREEGPRVNGECATLRQGRQASDEVVSISVILEDDAALESPDHHVVEGIRRI
jgi:hypothetical protein